MESQRKKAQRENTAPKTQSNYSRVSAACLILFFIAILILVFGRVFHNGNCTYVSIGMLSAAAIIDLMIIESEDE